MKEFLKDKKDLKEKEKLKRDEKAKRISKFKKMSKEPAFLKLDTAIAKRKLLDNPEVDASKFPGFDQANRIRGGLKKGGSAKKKKRGAAIRGRSKITR